MTSLPTNEPTSTTPPTRLGKVYLVGGGPGDPGLLTLRGRDLLQSADLVLYDGLVNPLLIRYCSDKAERTARAVHHGKRILEQSEIEQRLIDAARSGKMVVRLKGGDPFIFGRGSEEAEALAKAGIPFEVVPGITAATAVAEYAGISLTHREDASAVAFITGHEDPKKRVSSLDYNNLAHFQGTLVFYMGLHRLPEIAQSLIDAGKDPETVAAVISKGTTTYQKTISATLQELPEKVAAAQLQAPSLIVIGTCVARREEIQWFEKKPLRGLSIGMTRPEGQTEADIQTVIERGGQPVLMPLIQVSPLEDWTQLDAILNRISNYSMIVFTSQNGVTGFFNRLWELGKDARAVSHCRFTCIGNLTANCLKQFGFQADLIPEESRAEEVAKLLIADAASHETSRHKTTADRILWACASRGREQLPQMCQQAGLDFQQIPVYKNEDVESLSEYVLQQLEKGRLNWIGLSSPSIARQLARLLPGKHRQEIGKTIRLASISPVTTEAAKEAGLSISVEATTATWTGIFDVIETFER